MLASLETTAVASTSGRCCSYPASQPISRVPLARRFVALPNHNAAKRYFKVKAVEDDSKSSLLTTTNSSAIPLVQDTSPSPLKAASKVDPYRAAGQRLERLLAGAGDGEEELLNNLLMEESVDRKVFIAALAGVGISTVACIACWACGLDPVGGASLSVGSLRAAAVGGAAALPLVAIKGFLWSDKAHSMLPFLEDVQQQQINEFQPILYQLNPAQTLLVMGSEVIPGLLILLPAATGGCRKLLEMYFDFAGIETTASAVHNPFAAAASVSIAALLVAGSKLVDLTPSEEEYDTVKDALTNADRFYSLVGQGRDSNAADAKSNAAAFRAVAVTWLARRQVAARFAALLATLEVLFLGTLWHGTGDFTAPLVAGLASAAVDFAGIKRSMLSPPQSPTQGPSTF
ncbi:hypothetical protein Ndes2526A_g00201 [Nannochloris sp. 'desiccata']|nr:hypothetical protein KSW81_003010 [Chlorella desiccata (nom. nud.)]